MLADRIVVELYELGEFANTHRPVGVGNVAEEAMAGRVAKRTGFGQGYLAGSRGAR